MISSTVAATPSTAHAETCIRSSSMSTSAISLPTGTWATGSMSAWRANSQTTRCTVPRVPTPRFAAHPPTLPTPPSAHLRPILSPSSPHPHPIITLPSPHRHPTFTPSAPHRHPILTPPSPHPHPSFIHLHHISITSPSHLHHISITSPSHLHHISRWEWLVGAI